MRFYAALAAASLEGAERPFVLALIAGTKGSSPQRTGAKALFFADGKMIGTLGGGCLEAEVRARALLALESGKAESFEIVLDHLFGWDDGLICGGSVGGLILPRASASSELWRDLAAIASVTGTGSAEPISWGVAADFSIIRESQEAGPELLYRETVAPRCGLWIAGSGHVAQAVAPLAAQLDFAVTVFDDRPALANPEFFSADIRLRVGGWDELLRDVPPHSPSAATFGLIVTRGHQHDAIVLSEWIGHPFAFLGMIGSRRKARIIREQFVRKGIATEERFDAVACPVGLPIGAASTHEIAVSILAQFIEKRAAWRGARR